MGNALRHVRGESQKNIVRFIEGLSGKYSRWDIWQDFIIMSATAIANTMGGPQVKAREEMYRSRAEKYSAKELEVFADMLLEVVAELERDPEQDFLGELFMALGLGNEWKGQFFTPYSVCRAMSAMSYAPDMTARIEKQGWISVNDPACGAGALLLAFAWGLLSLTDAHGRKSPWPAVFGSAAAAVAAHECGHAVQHARGYAPLTLRSQLVPVVQFASTAATWVIILGLVILASTQNELLCWIGVGMIAMSALFSLVTLPVEYNASARAVEWLQTSRTMQGAQLAQAKEALSWAARTYLVAALSAIASVLYYVFLILGRRD